MLQIEQRNIACINVCSPQTLWNKVAQNSFLHAWWWFHVLDACFETQTYRKFIFEQHNHPLFNGCLNDCATSTYFKTLALLTRSAVQEQNVMPWFTWRDPVQGALLPFNFSLSCFQPRASMRLVIAVSAAEWRPQFMASEKRHYWNSYSQLPDRVIVKPNGIKNDW